MNKLQGKDYAALAFCAALLLVCVANIGNPAAQQGYVWFFTVVSAAAVLMILFKKSDAGRGGGTLNTPPLLGLLVMAFTQQRFADMLVGLLIGAILGVAGLVCWYGRASNRWGGW